MTPEWEHCTSAVLDRFGLDDVTLIGVSLGGYLAPRAASCDSRIARVVMYDLIYDFYGAIVGRMSRPRGLLFDWMTRHPGSFLWRSIDKKLDQNYFTKWLMGQGYAIFDGVRTPCEFFNYIKLFNTRELSQKLTQDVLVLAGESDLYTIFYDEQLKALTRARSVTGRLFTKEEHADRHCQVGNMMLLLKTISNWIEEKTNAEKSNADGRPAR
jgi:pimeloyl-ACP methyl ester carboxylesterase